MKRAGLIIAALGLFLFVRAAHAAWLPTQRLTWTSGASGVPAIAMDSSGVLHVLWEEDLSGNTEIYYKRSTDGGGTWTASQRLTWTLGYSNRPAIAVDSGHALHVVWEESTPGNYEIFYKKSTNGGVSWGASQRLTWTTGSSLAPCIAVDSSGNPQIAWFDSTPGNEEIYYKKSTNKGTSWAMSQRLTWNSGDSSNPALAVGSSGQVHVAWHDDIPGNYEIYYRKSTNSGQTWTTTQRLTWTSGGSLSPALAADSLGNVNLVWYEDTATSPEIYFRKSTNGGNAWTTGKRLTWTAGASDNPAITVDSFGYLYVAWTDNSPGNYEIYFTNSTDGGAAWATSQRLTSTAGDSYQPALIVDLSGNPHIVWHDYTPGNAEIYYKRYVK